MDHLTAQHLLREAGDYFFSDDNSIQQLLGVTRADWLRSIADAVQVMTYPHLFPPDADTDINPTFMGRCRELGPPYTASHYKPLAIVMHQAPNTIYSTLWALRNERATRNNEDRQP